MVIQCTGRPSNRIVTPGKRGLDALLADADGGIFVTGWLGGTGCPAGMDCRIPPEEPSALLETCLKLLVLMSLVYRRVRFVFDRYAALVGILKVSTIGNLY